MYRPGVRQQVTRVLARMWGDPPRVITPAQFARAKKALRMQDPALNNHTRALGYTLPRVASGVLPMVKKAFMGAQRLHTRGNLEKARRKLLADIAALQRAIGRPPMTWSTVYVYAWRHELPLWPTGKTRVADVAQAAREICGKRPPAYITQAQFRLLKKRFPRATPASVVVHLQKAGYSREMPGHRIDVFISRAFMQAQDAATPEDLVAIKAALMNALEKEYARFGQPLPQWKAVQQRARARGYPSWPRRSRVANNTMPKLGKTYWTVGWEPPF